MGRFFALLFMFLGATAGAGDDLTALIGHARQGDAPMPGAGPDATVAAQDLYAILEWPVHRDKRRRVAVGVDYGYTRYEYTGISGRNRDLHRLQLPVRFAYRRNDRQFKAYLAPGIATSSNVFKDFLNRGSGDDWYVSGAIEAQFGDPGRQWIFGAAHDRAFGDSSTYPIVGLRISPRSDLRVRLAYPVSGIAWQLSNRSLLTGRAMPAGFEWRVVSDDFASEFDYRVEGIRAQLNWTQRIYRHLSIDLSAAYEFDRKHELTDALGNRVIGYPRSEWLFAITFGIGGTPPASPHGVSIQSVTD